MNLAIEYFTRSIAHKDFFTTPCSLFLESFCETKKAIIVFQKITEDDCLIKVSQFDLYKWSQNGFPKPNVSKIHKDAIFENYEVLNVGFFPIAYQEEPINTSFNYYNHPMYKEQYENYAFNFLNSLMHKSYKKDWLWDSFTSVYLADKILSNKMQLPTIERRCVIEEEKRHVKYHRPRHWKLWKFWVSQFIFKEIAATELIFSSIYKSYQHS